VGPIVLYSISGAALIAGITLHVLAAQTRARLIPLYDGAERDAGVAELEGLRGGMASGYAVAGAGLIASTIWVLVGGDPDATAFVAPASGGALVGLRGRL
jgi:hypothetical protein